MSKQKHKCIDCEKLVYSLRCKPCAGMYRAKMTAARHLIDFTTLVIDEVNFTASDEKGVVLPIKMKFEYACKRCKKLYKATLGYERGKKHPWHCKSCAISLEWDNSSYREKHVVELKKANSTIAARQRTSNQSRLNWKNVDTRARMLNRDWRVASAKGHITRFNNLLSGKTIYRVSHGKRVLVCTTWMRSTYEARFANLLSSQNIDWLYEPKYFDVGNNKVYLPDFYLPSYDVYVEVKGWWRDDAKEKFEAFISIYSNLKYSLIMLDELKRLESKEISIEDCIIEARR
jgi:hypothetical protein